MNCFRRSAGATSATSVLTMRGRRRVRVLQDHLAAVLIAVALPSVTAGHSSGALASQAAPMGLRVAQTSSSTPLQAFVLISAPDSFADLQAHVGSVGVVYPTYFQCSTPSGAVLGAGDPQLDAYAAAHGLAELPRFTCQDGATVHRILTDPSLRAHTLARLLTLAGGDGLAGPATYAGLNLDLENDGAGDRGALSSFAAALAAGLHAEHRRLAVDVVGEQHEDPRHATYLYDDRAIVSVADTVFVMAWGVHWERSAPGPDAPLPYIRAVARRLVALPHSRRFVLGVPMYGLDWAGRGGRARPATALQYSDVAALASAVGAVPARDQRTGEMTFAYTRGGVIHRVWFMDARAVAQRIAIAHRYGLGAGVWRLGEEDQALWGAPGV